MAVQCLPYMITIPEQLIHISHLSILADFLIHRVDGGHFKVHDVDGHLGEVGLLEVPAQGLHLLQTARLEGDGAKPWEHISQHTNV